MDDDEDIDKKLRDFVKLLLLEHMSNEEMLATLRSKEEDFYHLSLYGMKKMISDILLDEDMSEFKRQRGGKRKNCEVFPVEYVSFNVINGVGLVYFASLFNTRISKIMVVCI
jgi:hypothetical protein